MDEHFKSLSASTSCCIKLAQIEVSEPYIERNHVTRARTDILHSTIPQGDRKRETISKTSKEWQWKLQTILLLYQINTDAERDGTKDQRQKIISSQIQKAGLQPWQEGRHDNHFCFVCVCVLHVHKLRALRPCDCNCAHSSHVFNLPHTIQYSITTIATGRK